MRVERVSQHFLEAGVKLGEMIREACMELLDEVRQKNGTIIELYKELAELRQHVLPPQKIEELQKRVGMLEANARWEARSDDTKTPE